MATNFYNSMTNRSMPKTRSHDVSDNKLPALTRIAVIGGLSISLWAAIIVPIIF